MWFTMGRAHYLRRVNRGESVAACAKRLGLPARTITDKEHGRADPGIIASD